MKKLLVGAALAAAILATAFLAPAQGQAEKIKQKAKDLKKQVESGQQPTNKPPQKTPPSPPVPPVPPKPAK